MTRKNPIDPTVKDYPKILLTVEQRRQFTRFPSVVPQQALVDHFTLSSADLAFVRQQRGSHNRLGIAIQLGTLRYLGRTLTDTPFVPQRVIDHVADQLNIAPEAFARYGERVNTFDEHLEKIRLAYAYRDYVWPAPLHLARHLLPVALHSDQVYPLIEQALVQMRKQRIIAPGMTTIEHLIHRVLRLARWIVDRRLAGALSTSQRTALDALLKTPEAEIDLSLLAWLRLPSPRPSNPGMAHLLDRIQLLRDLALPDLPTSVAGTRARQMAARARHYPAQVLLQFSPVQRRALLFTHLVHLELELVDQWLDMFDRWLGDLMRKGRNVQKHRLYRSAKTLNRVVNTFATAIEALFEARRLGSDPFETVFAVVDEEHLSRALDTAREHMRPANLDYRDLLQRRYTLRRKQLLAMFNTLSFAAVPGEHSALAALQHVARLQNEYGKRVETIEQAVREGTLMAPLEHLKHTRWKRHALSGNEINANYYEMAAFQRLKQGLRAGDIAVHSSNRYREFESYLLNDVEWVRLKQKSDTGLAVSDDPDEYLEEVQDKIAERLSAVQASLKNDGPVILDKDGSLKLKALESTRPASVKEWRAKIYARMPWVQLSEVVIEVDGWTRFLDSFTHLSSGMPTTEDQKPALIAALMATGMNLGLTRMAQATDLSYRQLAWAADWHFREETLRAAQAVLDDFVLDQPYSGHWGSGVTSMSDGMRFPVNVQAANAVYNPRYFGYRRGITIVTHSADIWMPFETQVINDVREALYVIDALCHNETDFDILEHYTDHAGYTFHVFALCRMLGFRFAPRIRGITRQYLYTVKPIEVSTAIEPLLTCTPISTPNIMGLDPKTETGNGQKKAVFG